ncbi:ABC transporter ATP-binding protein [Bacillaceae bacterium SIJ1]|uniref:ABC transporter ATP-binding protein n=1 Tax=Litoribacterium kuwaitense TaxID=1398745 RepID=UPI0013EBEB4C|nr:ABC transporter ATP-binding protein [Litoribacterium kuwaitense]NGP46264.1 ABC transporter ATP-binding protein [Litoribacterium kuwaitense]
MNPIIQVTGVTKTFAQTVALQPTNAAMYSGEFVSLIGPSGCGKSTLLDIMAGLEKPDEGDVLLEGHSVVGTTGYAGYMPQKDVLLPWRTILANVTVPLEIRGISKNKARARAMEWMEPFGLKGFEHHYPDQLSGGMRQRANFLRTCLTEKKLLLLDEPFGKLDALTRLSMQEWLISLADSLSLTIFFVTHDIEEALLLSDRIYVMSPRPGKIIKEMSVTGQRPRSRKDLSDHSLMKQKEELLDLLFSERRSS